jgi:hypothetical protein
MLLPLLLVPLPLDVEPLFGKPSVVMGVFFFPTFLLGLPSVASAGMAVAEVIFFPMFLLALPSMSVGMPVATVLPMDVL